MIDIVQTLREQHPDLGPYVLALRSGSPVIAESEPPRLASEAQAWVDRHAPQAVIARRTVRLPPTRHSAAEERTVVVASFATAQELAAFALAWT